MGQSFVELLGVVVLLALSGCYIEDPNGYYIEVHHEEVRHLFENCTSVVCDCYDWGCALACYECGDENSTRNQG